MEKQLQAIVTVLSLVNPLICGAMFTQIDAGPPRAAQLADATKVTLAVLVILVVAALVGARVLQIFGISLEAFSIAGGGVLSWIGFNMMRGGQTRQPLNAGADEERSFAPLILFAASPGTITGVITLAVAHAKLLLPVTVLVAVAVATLVMWVVMALTTRGGSRERGGDPIHGIDRTCHGRAVRADGFPRFFRCAALTSDCCHRKFRLDGRPVQGRPPTLRHARPRLSRQCAVIEVRPPAA
jgi:multiple antibiotic resistance protein